MPRSRRSGNGGGGGIEVHSLLQTLCIHCVASGGGGGEMEPSSQNRQAARWRPRATQAGGRHTLVVTSLKGRAHIWERCTVRAASRAESGQLNQRMVPIFGRWIGQRETASTAKPPLNLGRNALQPPSLVGAAFQVTQPTCVSALRDH